MPKIFITRRIPEAGLKLLKERGYDILINQLAKNRPAKREEILEGVKGVDALVCMLTDKIDKEIMDNGGLNLKIIANMAVGFDNIDLNAARERNIFVTNTPDVLTNTVAEHTFTLMLAISHRIVEADKFTRSGLYKGWDPMLLLGQDLFGKILGIVGLGRIGLKVAKIAINGFDMKVFYTDQRRNLEFENQFNATFFENINDLLPKVDYLSLHTPLLPETRHLINEERLKLMKPNAYLINTSRGPVVDEAALAKALKEKWISGAAIDVFENEPEVNLELMRLNNIILTPHIASATKETRDKMSEIVAKNIIEALEGREPPNLVNISL